MNHDFVGRAAIPSVALSRPCTKIGGAPIGLPEQDWPKCKFCGAPMSFLFQLDLHSPMKQASRYRFAYVFVCAGFEDGRRCDTWDGSAGGNAVVLVEDASNALCPTPSGVPARPERTIDWAPWEPDEGDDYARIDTDAAERVLAAIAEASEDDGTIVVEVPDSDDRPETVFVGGEPEWAQNDDTPACPTCNGPVRFVAQIYSEVEKHKFWPVMKEGYHLPIGHVGYLFTCEEECSRSSAFFLWQP